MDISIRNTISTLLTDKITFIKSEKGCRGKNMWHTKLIHPKCVP